MAHQRSVAELVGHIARTYSLLILLIISVLIYSFWGGGVSTAFNSVASWRNIASSQAVTGVLTLGILLVAAAHGFHWL